VKDADPARAALIATAWATHFTEQIHVRVAAATDLNAFIEASVTRNASAPVERSHSMSLYIFVGAVLFLTIGSIVVLLFSRPDRFSGVSIDRDTSDSPALRSG
jgi:hypothetical protein